MKFLVTTKWKSIGFCACFRLDWFPFPGLPIVINLIPQRLLFTYVSKLPHSLRLRLTPLVNISTYKSLFCPSVSSYRYNFYTFLGKTFPPPTRWCFTLPGVARRVCLEPAEKWTAVNERSEFHFNLMKDTLYMYTSSIQLYIQQLCHEGYVETVRKVYAKLLSS